MEISDFKKGDLREIWSLPNPSRRSYYYFCSPISRIIFS